MDYKYTGELNAVCGILGREEELNNYGRWETHEGNAAITGVDERQQRETTLKKRSEGSHNETARNLEITKR